MRDASFFLGSIMTPVATLKNGVRVANFSSPHAFAFDDGTVLSACDDKTSNRLMLHAMEVQSQHPTLPIMDISLEFSMSFAVSEALRELESRGDIDIVLVPFPVMTAIKESGRSVGKCRVCRVADRVTKTIHADKFCII